MKEFNTDISELPVIINENNVKLFDGAKFDKYDIINTITETNQSNDAFFIINLGEVIQQYKQWKELLPNVLPFYAIKSNPNPVIIKLLSCLGTGFDCASKNEIALVKEVCKENTKIIYANPCKENSQIQYARANDVDLLTFDDENELYKIKLFHPYSQLILRIKTDDSKSICRFNCKFGVDVDQVESLLNVAKTLRLNVVGVSFHVGSGCYSLEPFKSSIETSRKVFDIASKCGFQFNLLDIGGGFLGMDDIEKGIKFENVANVIRESLENFFPNEQFPELQIIAEPGRYFVTKSHTLVVNVIGKKELIHKETKEKQFIYYLNDGVYGSFNCIYFDHNKPKILPFNERDGKCYDSIVFGPTCDSMDLISDSVQLPELAIGEWCFVENFGAYTTAAATTFNGFKRSNVIYVLTY